MKCLDRGSEADFRSKTKLIEIKYHRCVVQQQGGRWVRRGKRKAGASNFVPLKDSFMMVVCAELLPGEASKCSCLCAG